MSNKVRESMKKASYGTGGWIKASNPFFNDIFIIIIIVIL